MPQLLNGGRRKVLATFEGVLNVVRLIGRCNLVGAGIALAQYWCDSHSAAAVVSSDHVLGGGAAIYLLDVVSESPHVIYDRSPLYRFQWAGRWRANLRGGL